MGVQSSASSWPHLFFCFCFLRLQLSLSSDPPTLLFTLPFPPPPPTPRTRLLTFEVKPQGSPLNPLHLVHPSSPTPDSPPLPLCLTPALLQPATPALCSETGTQCSPTTSAPAASRKLTPTLETKAFSISTRGGKATGKRQGIHISFESQSRTRGGLRKK